MPQQNYEEYWKLTLEYTDFNDDKFLTTLQLLVNKVDELNSDGDYVYNSQDYKDLQRAVLNAVPKSSSNINNQLGSTRKAINQCIKLGFVNPEFKSYHPNTKDYLTARSSRRRQTLFSKIVYSNAKFNSSITNSHNWSQINFLLKTLEEIGKLTKKDIIALMTIDIANYEREYVTESELNSIRQEAESSGFIERKYNQIGYLNNILNKLDDVVFIRRGRSDYELYFEEDAVIIFGADYKDKAYLKHIEKKRDPYLHRLYKNQLQEECEEIYGNPKCVLERLSYPVLIASHIKPFIDSNEIEAYDPDNGLLLSRTIDSLFDLKYISFEDNGDMIFSNRVSRDVKVFWEDYKLENTILNEKRKEYLAYHRNLMAEIDARA